ncbi:MAG: hypothetical protein CM15mV22_1380 [Eurybiavirus sp.]|nr:MAG: hypothetical protein CM15mV22_1380 [Eurybiavirus sp.]
MAYQRNDELRPVSPQPGKTTVNQFSGNEGWSTVTYENFNADYQLVILTILREHLVHTKQGILTILLGLLQRISVTIKTKPSNRMTTRILLCTEDTMFSLSYGG